MAQPLRIPQHLNRKPAWARIPLWLTTGAALLWLSLYFATFATLSSADQLDYAQIARHIWRGDGFVTSIAFPVTFSRYDSPANQPEFLHMTLFPFLIAPLYGAFGEADRTVVMVSGISYILLPAAVYGLTLIVSGKVRTAILAGVLTVFNQEMVEYSLSGLTEITFGLALVIALYLTLRRASPILVGISYGLCFLLRANFAVLLPGLVVCWVANRAVRRQRAEGSGVGQRTRGNKPVAGPQLAHCRSAFLFVADRCNSGSDGHVS